jgi:hypothetical protein
MRTFEHVDILRTQLAIRLVIRQTIWVPSGDLGSVCRFGSQLAI